ncbi:MAG: DUF2974 domain-containing protein, partial [Gallionella sp.]|nr:DUF2974 domain-containing protein [Gallionella sp.]
MATAIEYALMAGASYISTRSDSNKFPAPQGWIENVELRKNDPVSGFEATYFTNGSEYVISFAGTYDQSAADLNADANLGAGTISDQLIQAAEYYLQVKASAPVGANITLTGHSLGGGLASLVAVFFGESATTFDQAPFRNSASVIVATALRSALASNFSDAALFSLDKFLWSFDPLGLGWSNYGLDAREANVNN